MTITLAQLQESKVKYGLQLQQEYAKLNALQDSINRVGALLLQIEMLEIAEEFPAIERFSYDAEMAYDDQSDYFWTVSFSAAGEGFDRDEMEHHWEDYSDSLGDGADEHSTMLAFGSDDRMEGSITVAELRLHLLQS